MTLTRPTHFSPEQAPRPEFEEHSIAVRAYVTAEAKPTSTPVAKSQRRPAGASNWTLLFDTETTVDARQALRFGAYLVYRGERLYERGVFYDPAVLAADEVALLCDFSDREGLRCMLVGDFVEEVLFCYGYDLRGTICGFNLPFDLSRLALKVGTARSRSMSPGFTFTLSEKPWRPNIQIKHMNSRSALIQFTKPPRKPETRREWNKGNRRAARRGFFIDLKTHAAALTSRSFSLEGLGAFLKVENRKLTASEHGGPLTEDYIHYCVRDVETTWDCYRALRDKLDAHGLRQTEPSKIMSEAGIGKGYLKEMGIRPLMELRPDIPPRLLGIIWSTFYGGRAEVHWRREICRVLYCDFLSMYPTVCTLMELFRFVRAKGFETRDATDEVRSFLTSVTRADLQSLDTWKKLTVLVEIRPDDDILPVRARYAGPQSAATIGINHLSADEPLWFTLADVIASKLLTGKAPTIVEAMAFEPGELQDGLSPINLLGKTEYRVDPGTDDLFRTVINLRTATKARLSKAAPSDREELKTMEQALKILANSTSYGIFVEVNVQEEGSRKPRVCHGPTGVPIRVETHKVEEPGRYFHPLLGTLITGAARLMLAIAETLVRDGGLEWAFCDTDSMAIAKPPAMGDELFLKRALAVSNWFEGLNPYDQKGPLFKLEGQNFAIVSQEGSRRHEPLYCLAISSKRYALFNIGADGLPIIRKASAHGLGHLLAPYGADEPAPGIPTPQVPLDEIGVSLWHHDLWYQIIRAVQKGCPNQVALDYHPALSQPATSRYGATSPDLLRWFDRYNRNRNYRDRVKPFNFLTGLQAKSEVSCAEEFVLGPRKRGRKPKIEPPKPIAPYDKDPAAAARNAFDRRTGKPVSPTVLKTYAEAISGYHLSPEDKFVNGDRVDRGLTRRRHIRVRKIELIGKEANRVEEAMQAGLLNEEISYGHDGAAQDLDSHIRALVEQFGQRGAAERLGISRTALIKALRQGVGSLSAPLKGRVAAMS